MTVLSLRIPFVASFLATLLSSAPRRSNPRRYRRDLRAADTAAHAWLALVDKGETPSHP